jgi:hypothetical protein
MRPARARLAGIAASLLAASALAAVTADRLPPTRELLDDCLRALPDVPLAIRGELTSRTADGETEKKLQVEMLMDWRATPAVARYTIRDRFGKTLDHLSLTWPAAGPVEYRYFTGDPLAAAPRPNLSDAVHGTDISWMDLSLAFLWWTNGLTRGAESVRSRPCYIADVWPDPGTCTNIGGVRLWIDPELHLTLRAELYDATNGLARRMDIKGFKKINGRWFIKDIDVQSLPSRHKTVLRVNEVEDRERKQFIRLDEDGVTESPAEKPESVAPVTPVP